MTRGRGVQEFIFKWGRDGLGPRCQGAEVSRGRDGLGPKRPVTLSVTGESMCTKYWLTA